MINVRLSFIPRKLISGQLFGRIRRFGKYNEHNIVIENETTKNIVICGMKRFFHWQKFNALIKQSYIPFKR